MIRLFNSPTGRLVMSSFEIGMFIKQASFLSRELSLLLELEPFLMIPVQVSPPGVEDVSLELSGRLEPESAKQKYNFKSNLNYERMSWFKNKNTKPLLCLLSLNVTDP